MKRKPSRSVVVALSAAAVLAAAVGIYCSRSRATPLERMAADLGSKPGWPYGWLLKHDGGKASRLIPAKLHIKAVRSEISASMASRSSASALIDMGTNAWLAIPALLEALESKNADRAVLAAEVLAAIDAIEHPRWEDLSRRLQGCVTAGEAFRYLLRGHQRPGRARIDERRAVALAGLEAVGPAAAPAVPLLLSICESEEEFAIRRAAVMALASVAPDDERVLPLLWRMMADSDEWPQVRAAAMEALSELTPADGELAAALRRALNDPSIHVQIGAAVSLWRMGVDRTEVLPTLVAGTRHKLPSVRIASLNALSRMGHAALPAQAAVQDCTTDAHEKVRQAAQAALHRLEP